MKKIFLLSDTHFGTGSDQAQRLTTFSHLRELVLTQGKALYLLGDIFDFWIEYGSTIRKEYEDTIALLKQVSDAGIPVTFIRGNHEFMRGTFLQDFVGIEVVDTRMTITVGDKQILLLHGHDLAPRPLFTLAHGILSNPFFQWLYTFLPARIGVGFAEWVSGKSRASGGPSKQCGESSLFRYHKGVQELLASLNVDAVIMGHTHRAEVVSFEEGMYANGGSWLNASHYLTIDEIGTIVLNMIKTSQ